MGVYNQERLPNSFPYIPSPDDEDAAGSFDSKDGIRQAVLSAHFSTAVMF
jgi:hypothetical protein